MKVAHLKDASAVLYSGPVITGELESRPRDFFVDFTVLSDDRNGSKEGIGNFNESVD